MAGSPAREKSACSGGKGAAVGCSLVYLLGRASLAAATVAMAVHACVRQVLDDGLLSLAATRGLLRGQVASGSRALLWRRRGLETCATPRWSRGEPRRRAGALLWRAWARPPRLLRVCSRSVASVRQLGLSGNCGAMGTVGLHCCFSPVRPAVKGVSSSFLAGCAHPRRQRP